MNINESFRWSCVLCLSWYFNFQIQQIWTIRLHHIKNVCIVSSNCALTITTFRKKLRKTVQQILMMTSIVTSLLPLKSRSCQGNVWDLSGEAFCFSCLLNHLLSHDCLLIFSSPYNLFFLPWQINTIITRTVIYLVCCQSSVCLLWQFCHKKACCLL